MAFLTPLFFVGLAGLAIPVLIHLIQRERKRVVQFPSLMFLQRIPYRSTRRRRIHNWALLLIRLAALALIVAAFARPFFTGSVAAIASPGAREVVIALDQSYSMDYGGRWDRARAAAREAIEGLGRADRASLLLFNSGAEVAVRSTSEKSRLLSALDAATPTAGATRYAPVLKVAGAILAESSLGRRETVLISDFQRTGWQGVGTLPLPAGSAFTPVVVRGDEETPNATVTTVSLDRSTFAEQERVAVTASVLNHSGQSMRVPVALEVGPRAIETQEVTVEAGGTASVTFAPVTLGAGDLRGTVRLGPDALERDNAFYFLMSPIAPVHVLVVERGGAAGATSLYLLRALSIGETPRFEVVVRAPGSVQDEDLRRSSVVVLNDVPVPEALAGRLSRFVETGGGLLVVFGPRAAWPSATVDLLPVTVGAPVDRTRNDAARVGGLEYGHSIFEPFRSPRSGDFSAARVYGYRLATVAGDGQVLARFDSGAPALVERRVGDGRVLAWLTTLDLQWADLPLKPTFLPFVHGVARHLAAYALPAPWLTVGGVLDPAAAPAAGRELTAAVALTPSGRRVPLDGDDVAVLEVTEEGFYEVRAQAGGAPGVVVASNVETSESDLTPMAPADLASAAGVGAEGVTGEEIPLSREAQEGTQRLWWYLLCAGIVLLAADTVFSNRLSKSEGPRQSLA